MDFKAWDGFNKSGEWTKEIDVRGFIRYNYTPYDGDSSFLKGATEKTKKLWNEVLELKRSGWRFRCRYKNTISNKCI